MNRKWMEQALEGLRAATGRSGAARRSVVEFLGRQDCCLSAQEIHDGVRAERTQVGIASVYRALDALDRTGLVQRIDLGDGIARFEPAHTDGAHHHHLVCDDCGKVEPFTDSALEATLDRIARGRRYHIGGHDVTLRGACAECRR